MLDYIDRFAEERYRQNEDLEARAIWIGNVASSRALTRLLAPDDPQKGGFAALMGEGWYDSDFLETTRQRRGPAERLIGTYAEDTHIPDDVRDALLEQAATSGIETANTIIAMHQHTWDGEGSADATLHFLGNHEFVTRPPERRLEGWNFITGITDAADRDEFEQYVTGGGLAADLAPALDAPLTVDDLVIRWEYIGPEGAAPPEQLIEEHFPIAENSDIGEKCRDAGVESADAIISVREVDHLYLHKIALEARFCGLRDVGFDWLVA